jgi:hypothetical protein
MSVNSLRNHIDKWKSIEANQYILNVIDQGCRLPYKTLPVNISLDNNRLSKDNKSFVSDETYLVLSLTDLPNTACVEISCSITEASNPTGITLVVCRLLQMYLKQDWTQECPDLKKSDKISIADNNKFEFGFSNPTDNALQLKSH